MPHATVRATAAAAAVILVALTSHDTLHAADITEAEAQALGVDAYLYFYPLITMDVTRRQLTNVTAEDSEIGGAPNTFKNVQAFPSAEMRSVVRPNFDTLYSSAWLDLTQEPVVVSVPDTGGRYYLMPMLDMWTDVFASPGWRTTGTAAANFLITPPGWRIESGMPENMQLIAAPTPYVWVIGRTKTDGPADYDAVHKIQQGYRVTPLSQWGKTLIAQEITVDPSVDMKTAPKVQVDTMPAERYFEYAAELLKLHPPHITDEPIIARLKRIGFEVGRSFDFANTPAEVQKGLAAAPAAAQKLMAWKAPTLARVANGWSMNTDTMGVYGNYYLKRAMVAQLGLGANLPEDAVYPLNLADASGKPLDGVGGNYTLHFAKDELPPAKAFWSVTLYDNDGFQVANPLNRFALSSWMPFKTNADGSLDLYFQNVSPGADKEANWLPAPKGPFSLTMRIYAPERQVLTGEWNPPPVTRAE
jgi:hypothetical protein